MPELADVEYTRRRLQRAMGGARITRVLASAVSSAAAGDFPRISPDAAPRGQGAPAVVGLG